MNRRIERFNEIIRLTKRTKHASISELARELEVSEMTIRRDLATLAEHNVVQLIPGGAILNPEAAGLYVESRYELPSEAAKHFNEKMRMAERALTLVQPDDVITLDAGSTTGIVARLLPRDFPCTIICTSYNVLYEIQQKSRCRVILTGGYYYPETATFESPQGVELIRDSRANIAFISARGVHPDLGVTTAYRHEVETKKALMSSSKKKVLLLDSTKFDRVEAAYFAQLEEFDTIITDSNLGERCVTLVESLGIELLLV